MLLLCALIVGTNVVWAADGDTHDFSQSLSQLLNNNASISSINIAAQSYPVKEVIISYRYNNTKKDAVTISVTVAGDSWGSFNVNGTGSNYLTESFTNEQKTGVINITFTNNTGNGKGHGTFYVNNIQLVEGAAAGTTATPTISGNTPFYDNTTVTITNDGSAAGADIFYTLNGSDPTTTTSATCFAYSNKPFQVSATTIVKAIAKKSSDTNASSVVSKTFTKVTPMTVTDALTAIAGLADNGTIADRCVTGIVSTAGSLSSGAITYKVSVDGAATNELQVYKGKGLNGADFEDESDIAVGDEVVIYGTLKKYKSGANITPEFDQNSYLLSKVRKPAPTFSLDISERTLDAYTQETVDVTLTTNTDGAITCESDDEDVAIVALKSGNVYTITAKAEGTATITIRSAASANYSPASAEVAITVTDEREDAGISFSEASISKTWGQSFSGQNLTNTHSVTVIWSSTDEAVATVNASTGAVTMLKAGSTTIKATFAGNATYKAAVASYDLTINKANAGLSYTPNAFDIMLNDASFDAPTVNNPNSLVVTYASNNTSVAMVDENTGELIYDDTKAGTAIITATFAGNDQYKSGSASYTITIVDPTVKGSKYNPYTVAEVIDGTATGSGIYVKGFIVGEYVGKTTDPRTSGFTTDANIAIADPFTSTPTASGSIPVALPTDALKSAWGCKTNGTALFGYEVLLKGNKDTYFSVNGIKSTSEVSAVSIPISTAAGQTYGTLVSDYNLDFSDASGIAAFKVTDVEEGVIQTAALTEVPSGTPILIETTSAGATINVPVAASTPATITDNKLKVGANSIVSDEDYYRYVLAVQGGVTGFFKLTSATNVPANRAYLELTVAEAASAPSMIRIIDEENNATNIENIESEEKAVKFFENGQLFIKKNGITYDTLGRIVK